MKEEMTYKLIKRSWCGYIYIRQNRLKIRALIKRDKARNFYVIKGSIHQEDRIIINIYVTNNISSKSIKQKHAVS